MRPSPIPCTDLCCVQERDVSAGGTRPSISPRKEVNLEKGGHICQVWVWNILIYRKYTTLGPSEKETY